MTDALKKLAADRRLEPRQPVLRPGRLLSGDWFSADVLIVDLSINGARVRLRQPARTPTGLILVDRRMWCAHRAVVAWGRDGELGLKLTQSFSLKGAVPAPLLPAKSWCREAIAPPDLDVVHI